MKSKLVKLLSGLEDFQDPKASLEQYMTPPELAADILHSAEMQEDVGAGKKVVDLGSGTGIFAIGAALLGSEVVAVEKDEEALETAEKNAGKLEVRDRIEFRHEEVAELKGDFDTCLMNPPFSVHSEEEIKFFEKALEVSSVIYSIVYEERLSEVRDRVERSDFSIVEQQSYSIELPPTHGFHTEEAHEAELCVIVARK
ncbi:MAG: METTL5 family protein [Candidatus Nanohaloarchaea archaeon]